MCNSPKSRVPIHIKVIDGVLLFIKFYSIEFATSRCYSYIQMGNIFELEQDDSLRRYYTSSLDLLYYIWFEDLLRLGIGLLVVHNTTSHRSVDISKIGETCVSVILSNQELLNSSWSCDTT